MKLLLEEMFSLAIAHERDLDPAGVLLLWGTSGVSRQTKTASGRAAA